MDKNSPLPIVLIIDEVDSASNNQVFLDFLALIRDLYISRDTDGTPAFQSVILAGVTDIKHLKGKLRSEDQSKVNSPWNIATDFNIDMSLSEDGIKGMLDEYEADHHTGMDTAEIAKLIRDYTNGYPYLVSRICELIDKKICEYLKPQKACQQILSTAVCVSMNSVTALPSRPQLDRLANGNAPQHRPSLRSGKLTAEKKKPSETLTERFRELAFIQFQ